MFYSGISVASAPTSWQFGFPAPATEIMEVIVKSHSFAMSVMVTIMLFVWALLAYVMFRFRKSKVTNISKTHHNVLLEIVWFVIPTIIVGILAFENAKLLKLQEKYRRLT